MAKKFKECEIPTKTTKRRFLHFVYSTPQYLGILITHFYLEVLQYVVYEKVI